MNISIKQIEILEKIKNKSSLPLQNEERNDIEWLLNNHLIAGSKSMHRYTDLSITPQGNEYLVLLESYVDDIFKSDSWLDNLPKYLKAPLYILACFGFFMMLLAMAHNLGFNT